MRESSNRILACVFVVVRLGVCLCSSQPGLYIGDWPGYYVECRLGRNGKLIKSGNVDRNVGDDFPQAIRLLFCLSKKIYTVDLFI
jgi:hypothetical protein